MLTWVCFWVLPQSTWASLPTLLVHFSSSTATRGKAGAQRHCENAPRKASTGAAPTGQEATDREVNHLARTCPLESETFAASMLPAYIFARPLGIIAFFQTLLFQQHVSSYSSSETYSRKPKKYYFPDGHAPNIENIALPHSGAPWCSFHSCVLSTRHVTGLVVSAGTWSKSESHLKKLTLW